MRIPFISLGKDPLFHLFLSVFYDVGIEREEGRVRIYKRERSQFLQRGY